MRQNAASVGIKMLEAPVKIPGRIGVMERYHATLRAAYEMFRAESPLDNSNDDCLKLAVFAVNATVGAEGP